MTPSRLPRRRDRPPSGPDLATDSPRRLAAAALPVDRPPPWRRLGFRLGSLLALALLPLGAIGLVQAGAWRDAARDRAAAALMGETLRAAEPTVGLIREARGAARAMAQTVGGLVGDDPACVDAMTALKDASPQYSVAAFVPASGLMTCASDGAAFDYRPTALFQQIVADGFAPMVYVQARGPVSGVSVVLVVEPVPDPSGGPALGYVGLALPHAALATPASAFASAPDGPSEAIPDRRLADLTGLPIPDFLTFNGAGTVLTTSRGYGEEAGLLPQGVALDALAEAGAGAFEGRTQSGEPRDFAVVPLVEGALYALGSSPARRAFALGPVAAAAPVLTTLLLWVASFAVAWWAAERLVTRHMRGLAGAFAAFAGGAREVAPLDLDRAPAEIRAVEQAFLRMTDTILHDEAELEDGLHQREVLLREIHHRSKNNLQLIASIINLQVRRVRSEEARGLMRGLQERVMSLAAVHRELYQTTGSADVRADELLGDIARQVVGATRRGRPTLPLDLDLAPLQLGADQAVPLALLLTEGLTQASAWAARAPDGRLRVPLRPDPARGAEDGAEPPVVLSVEAAAPGATEGEPEPGTDGDLGAQLIGAFAAQVSGEVEMGVAPGDGQVWRLRVTFPLRAP